jgi:D-alanyl-D-alanine carboxypeptidase
MRNYNSLLGTDGIVGVKTGSTRPAGGNLVFAARTADRFGQRFVVGAVLGQRVGEAAPVGLAAALSSAHALVRAAAVTPRRMTVLPAGTLVGTLHRADGGESIPVTISRPVELVGWPGLTPSLQTRSQQPAGLPTAGSQVGTLVAALGNQQAQAPLVSAGSLAEPSWSSRVLRVR